MMSLRSLTRTTPQAPRLRMGKPAKNYPRLSLALSAISPTAGTRAALFPHRPRSASLGTTLSGKIWPSHSIGPSTDIDRLESFAQSACSSLTPSRPVLPPPVTDSSQFRLSLSLEGKAEVVASTVSSPRPSLTLPSSDAVESLGPIRRPCLRRSQSASSPITLPPISVLTSSLPGLRTAPLPPRLTRGRSRDVHAWEFCCDAENRDDFLTVQAKHESSGSAIAAITLLRSTSASGSPLQPSSSAKRNAATSRAPSRPGLTKKPKLVRALSSAAKLQSKIGIAEPTEFGNGCGTGPARPSFLATSGNDSDKENWSPDEDGNPHFTFSQPEMTTGATSRQPLPSGSTKLDKKNPRRTPRRFLQEHRDIRSLFSSRAYTTPAFSQVPRGGRRGQSPLDIYEDTESTNPVRPAVDDEVERFMRGEVSPSKKGDVDAVAGLLSLSQGNWRHR